ncbi:MAG TPA: M20 family metallopeptidase [Acetobacteraceae bacterium]|nr:M20 family metallopeptidase [Acetobacteraceae bacterium]
MIALIGELVAIDSGTYDKPGTDAVGATLLRFLEDHGVATRIIPQPRFGDTLLAEVPGGSVARGNIVLMGHRDTVYSKGTAAERPFTVHDGIAYGPGVSDMKSGLVMNSFVLAAFAKFGGAPGPLIGLYTADEEIGSPEGRPVIEAEARRARVVLNSEPARASGNVVTGRRGGVFSAIRIIGKAAHSGARINEGISALEELAHKIIAIHALRDDATGLSFNVGLARGGQSVNSVAPWAECEVDMRYRTLDQRDAGMAALEAVVSRSWVPGTAAKLEIRGEFLAMIADERSQALFRLHQRSAEASGFRVDGEYTLGCADSGLTAALGVPTLCATGPQGHGGHSPAERLVLDSLVPRAQAMARTILGLEAAGL